MKKICSRCKDEKELSEFPKCNRSKLGVKSECKKCHNSYKRTNRPENWVKDLSDEYVKAKLKRTGFSIDQVRENPQLVTLRRELIKLRRNICQQNSTT